MKTKIYQYVLSFLILISALPAYSEAPVWKVEKGDHQLFIGGTIHLLTPTDYPLPPTFEKAYHQSERLIFETDMQKMNEPVFQLTMMRQLIFIDGRTIKDVLSEKTYQTLVEYCAQRGIPVDTIKSFKPGMVAMMLTMMELQRLGVVGTGVDSFFSSRAIQDRKGLGQLETLEQQLSFVASMGAGQEDEMIAYTLRDIKELPVTWQTMKTAWRQGDLHKLKEMALTPLKKDFPGVYDAILVVRNNAWMPQIEAMLKTQEIEFVLVGALHLVGEDGLLAKLSARGYKIEML